MSSWSCWYHKGLVCRHTMAAGMWRSSFGACFSTNHFAKDWEK